MKRLFVTVLFLMLFSVVSNAQQEVECGDIIEGEFTENDQLINYSISLQPGDTLRVQGRTFGRNLGFRIFILGPTSLEIAYSGRGHPDSEDFSTPFVDSNILPARGDYTISLTNENWWLDSMGVGVYILHISCTLRDGTVIAPGDSLEPEPTQVPDPVPPSFTGFGFPGLPPVDFSAGIEIPIAKGQPQTAPIAADLVALYAYTASEGETVTLSLSRASGNLSIGVTVIKRENNEIIFLGGMPSSNNLSVELSFPTAGDYVIGLFALNTGTLAETSGAVTIRLD